MKRLTSLTLELKSQKDTEMVALYKKQIAQLAACIADREGRIARRGPVIEKISAREVSDFSHKVNAGGLKHTQQAPAIGDMFQTNAGTFHLCVAPTGIIGFKNMITDIYAVAGKDLETIAVVFFMDYPEATKI